MYGGADDDDARVVLSFRRVMKAPRHDSQALLSRASSPSFENSISHHHRLQAYLLMSRTLRHPSVKALSRAFYHRPVTKWKLVKPIQGSRNNATIENESMDEPRLISHNNFENIDAIYRWFKPIDVQAHAHKLKTEPLRPYASTIVPLEYTGPDATDSSKTIFKRFNAPLGVFLDYMEQPTENMRLYLAQCSIKDLPTDIQQLFPAPPFIDRHGLWRRHQNRSHKPDIYDIALWIGPPPTYTPLHRDPNPNCFFQMAGKKTIRLFPPDKGLEIFQRVKQRIGEAEGDLSGRIRGEEMMMGKEKEELEKEVWSSGYDPESGGLEARLERGRGLYIPQGWWHSVRGHGLGVTASVSSDKLQSSIFKIH